MKGVVVSEINIIHFLCQRYDKCFLYVSSSIELDLWHLKV